MAIALDSHNHSSGATTTSKFSFSYTVGASLSNSILVVGLTWGGSPTSSGITYGGQALTKVDGVANGTTSISEIWYLKNPPSGANTLEVTLSANSTNVGLSAISLSGVDQTSPIDAHNNGSGTSTSPSTTITTVADNAWVIDEMMYGQINSLNVLTANSPQVDTEHFDMSTTRQAVMSRIEGKTPAGSVSPGWSATGSARAYSQTVVSLKPASGATTPTFTWHPEISRPIFEIIKVISNSILTLCRSFFNINQRPNRALQATANE